MRDSMDKLERARETVRTASDIIRSMMSTGQTQGSLLAAQQNLCQAVMTLDDVLRDYEIVRKVRTL